MLRPANQDTQSSDPNDPGDLGNRGDLRKPGAIHEQATPPVSRYMALDVGDRRIGVAVSDALGLTAQPILTLTRINRRHDLKSIGRLLRRHDCTAIVVGNPMYMSGDLSPQAIKAQAFAQLVREEFKLPVHLWDERLTSTEAHRHLHAAGRRGVEHKQVVDQVAAVLILQNYLDHRQNEIDRAAKK